MSVTSTAAGAAAPAITAPALTADTPAAKSAADLLTEAKVAVDAFLKTLAGDAEAAVPALSEDALVLIEDFIPTPWRTLAIGVLNTAAGAAIGKLDAAIEAAVGTAFAIAQARIDALL